MSLMVISSQLVASTYPSANLIVSIKNGKLKQVNDCIINGADLNVRIGSYNVTPVMLAVESFVENYIWTRNAVACSLLVAGASASIVALGEDLGKYYLRIFLVPGGISSMYGMCKGFSYLINGPDRFAIIKLLLEQKSVNVTLTNDKQPKQTLLSQVQDYIQEYANSGYLVSRLKEIEELILAKQASKNVEVDTQSDIAGIKG